MKISYFFSLCILKQHLVPSQKVLFLDYLLNLPRVWYLVVVCYCDHVNLTAFKRLLNEILCILACDLSNLSFDIQPHNKTSINIFHILGSFCIISYKIHIVVLFLWWFLHWGCLIEWNHVLCWLFPLLWFRFCGLMSVLILQIIHFPGCLLDLVYFFCRYLIVWSCNCFLRHHYWSAFLN